MGNYSQIWRSTIKTPEIFFTVSWVWKETFFLTDKICSIKREQCFWYFFFNTYYKSVFRIFKLPLPGSGVVGGSGVESGLNVVLVVDLVVVEAGLWVVLICFGLFFLNPSFVRFSSVDEGTILDEPLKSQSSRYSLLKLKLAKNSYFCATWQQFFLLLPDLITTCRALLHNKHNSYQYFLLPCSELWICTFLSRKWWFVLSSLSRTEYNKHSKKVILYPPTFLNTLDKTETPI